MNIEEIRKQFPFIVKHPENIFLDNGATTQKPTIVQDAVNEYIEDICSNAGRSSYTIANKVTGKINEVRSDIARFINSYSENDIVFTSGATHGLNLVAYSFGMHNLRDGDEILVCLEDHKSSLMPWIHIRDLLKKMDINVTVVPYKLTTTGEADIEDLVSKVNSKTRIIAITHIHNVYGIKSNVERLRPKVGDNVYISVDGAQSIGHIPIDVKALGVDFFAFSGHKMFALPGSGALYVHPRVHKKMNPVIVGGGDDISEINVETLQATPGQMPQILEAGTPNITGILSLGAAIKFIEGIGIIKIHGHLIELTQYLIAELYNIRGITFLPGIAKCGCSIGYGIVSFLLEGISSADAGFILNENNILVRTGNHCRSIVDENTDSIRVSMHIYNTKEEIDQLIRILQQITEEI